MQQNLFIGGALAIVVLLLFLGSVRPTIVVATAIPVSVLGAFVGMALLGRSLNVISLAGMAFAVDDPSFQLRSGSRMSRLCGESCMR